MALTNTAQEAAAVSIAAGRVRFVRSDPAVVQAGHELVSNMKATARSAGRLSRAAVQAWKSYPGFLLWAVHRPLYATASEADTRG